MGFFDTAQDIFDKGVAAADKGVAAAKGAVSGLAVEQQAFTKDFIRLCEDAFRMGWHEANGGNLSYVLTQPQVETCRPYFYTTPGAWVDLSVACAPLSGEYLLVTGSGKHFRNVNTDPGANCGIVQISSDGARWRTVWGLKDGKPTSEMALHLSCLAACKGSGKDTRVVYHAHPANLMAATALIPVDSKELTRVMWKGLAEGVIACPQGVAALPWFVPGTPELAAACADALAKSDAAVAVNHGVFCACESFDQAFGLVQTLDKAAGIYLQSRAANGGSSAFLNAIPDQGIKDIAQRYGLNIDENYLN